MCFESANLLYYLAKTGANKKLLWVSIVYVLHRIDNDIAAHAQYA